MGGGRKGVWEGGRRECGSVRGRKGGRKGGWEEGVWECERKGVWDEGRDRK